MSDLPMLIAEFNPGISLQAMNTMLSQYSAEKSFDADWARTKPNVQGNDIANRGYTRLDTMEVIPANSDVGPFLITVKGRRPYMTVDYDKTGQVSTHGRMMRTNLFNRLAGWRWISSNPPSVSQSYQRTTRRLGDVLISVDDGRQHYYTLEFDTGGLDGILYTKPGLGEPRNRPSVKGRLVLDTVVGQIRTSAGRKHPVYQRITVIPTGRNGVEPIIRG